jgi:hypothetical protein
MHIQKQVELEKDCYHILLEGGKRKDVMALLVSEGLLKANAHKFFMRVVKDLDAIRDAKLTDTVKLHSERYEELFANCMNWGMELQAMTVMEAKEKLVGMIKNDEDSKKLYNFKKDQIVMEDDYYNFDSLEGKEHARLHELLAKMGITDGYKQIGN